MRDEPDEMMDWVAAELRRPVDVDPARQDAIMGRILALRAHRPWRAKRPRWSFHLGPRGVLTPGVGLSLAAGIAGLMVLTAVEPDAATPQSASDSVAARIVCDTMRAFRDTLQSGHRTPGDSARWTCDSILRSDSTNHG